MVVPGTVMDFGPDGLRFGVPAQLTIAYDPLLIPVGATESSLRLFKAYPDGWHEIPGSSPDLTLHLVRGPINGFSTYAIRATPAALGEDPDAGESSDGGEFDSGSPNAEQDGGVPDAGTLEAGAPDAGSQDAGAPDAGSRDAGAPDAGSRDAGAPDAGSRDAGTRDAGVLAYLNYPGIGTQLQGVAMTPVTPLVSGPIRTFSVAPALPAGLRLDPNTGTISGTPTTLTPVQWYVVSALDTTGAVLVTDSVVIEVLSPQAPLTLTYDVPSWYLVLGDSLNVAPNTSGGPITAWSVVPTLPPGLSLDPVTGVLQGTSTVLTPYTVYRITGSNQAGSRMFEVALQVGNAAPQNITYLDTVPGTCLRSTTTNRFNCYQGSALRFVARSTYGRAPTVYRAVTALPAGLSLDPVTGEISGSSTAASEVVTQIEGANGAGVHTVAVGFGFIPAPDAGLRDAGVSDAGSLLPYLNYPGIGALVQGIAMTPVTPLVSGPIRTFSVAPALPAGLQLDANSGTISGTPTASSPASQYVVSGLGTAGAVLVTRSVGIEVLSPQAPLSLTYNVPSWYLVLGDSLNVAPTTSGGQMVTWSVVPTLPPGLSLNPVSGVLQGTSTALTPYASYRITGSNPAGSRTFEVALQVGTAAPLPFGYSDATDQSCAPGGTPGSSNRFTCENGAQVRFVTSSTYGRPPTAYRAITPLPVGFSLNPVTGEITGSSSGSAVTSEIEGSNAAGAVNVTLFFDFGSVVQQPPVTH